jgi:acyl dehydratase
MSESWWEDIEISARRELGSYTFTEEEIIRFARKYDPQIFHLDPEAAKRSMYGGLIASGAHTTAVWMKLAVADSERSKTAGNLLQRTGVSTGFTDLKWLKPVRPGTTLTYSSEVTNKVELKSQPDMGLVESLNEARNESGEVVFSFIGKGFVQRKPR